MNYAIKTPDGQGIFKVMLDSDLPSGKTPEELDLWPVDPNIDDGFEQDFGQGSPAGWYLSEGIVRPCVKPIPEVVPVVPVSVKPWQMRRALNQLGLRPAVNAALEQADLDARDAWEVASEFRRDNGLLVGMAQALGMTETEIDNLFILAASFE